MTLSSTASAMPQLLLLVWALPVLITAVSYYLLRG